MAIKFAQYNSIIESLVTEAIACSPPSWNEGTLTIDCDGRAINYKLKNESQEEKAQISNTLRSLCEKLYVAMRDNGDQWTQSVIKFARKGESWGFHIDFKYTQKSGATPPPLPAPLL